jgi:hypothetical protein
LIAIADAVDDGRLSEGEVQEVGWSKARLIAEYASSKTESRRAIGFARRNTLPALMSYCKQNGTGTALVTKSFHLTPEQAGELDAALLQAGAGLRRGRMDARSDALMRIIRTYCQPCSLEQTQPLCSRRPPS